MPLRILLDIHISPDVADGLKALGVDAISVAAWQQGKFSSSNDETILKAAHKERRTFATYDVSSIPKLIQQFVMAEVHHSGIIFISAKTVPQSKTGLLIRSLEKLARHYKQSDLLNMVTWAPRA